MNRPSFIQRCRTEWRRLNPKYLPETKGLLATFKAAFQEGWRGCFTPGTLGVMAGCPELASWAKKRSGRP